MSKIYFFKNQKFLNILALTLIFIFFILIVVLSAVGYPNVLSIVAPVSLFVGFWIWQHQEIMKRKADISEILLKSYWDLEKNIIQLKNVYLKSIKLNPNGNDEDVYINLVNEICEQRDNCLICKSKFISDANLFFYRVSQNISQHQLTKFISEFNCFDLLINQSKQIEGLITSERSLIKYSDKFDDLVGYIHSLNFGEEDDKPHFFDHPRSIIQSLTKDYFQMKIIFD